MIDQAKLKELELAIRRCFYGKVRELIEPESEYKYTGCYIEFKIHSIKDKTPSIRHMIPFEVVKYWIKDEERDLEEDPSDEDAKANLIELEKIEKLLRDVTMRYAIQTENTDLLDILDKNDGSPLGPLVDGIDPHRLAKDQGKTKIVKWYDDKDAVMMERLASLNNGLASKLGMLKNIDANMEQAITKRNERANAAAAAFISKVSGASSK